SHPSTRTSWFSPCCAACRRGGKCAGSCADCWARRIRCWAARCSGCASRHRSGWPRGSTKTAPHYPVGVRWGFGYAEIGTVTAHPQPGNPAPRLFRLADDRALLNRMGFNNHGARALAIRLARHRPEIPIGVNIGKTKKTPAGDAVNDYRASARMVGPLASYLVVNVSSPNTPGLRDLQAVESLRPILSAVRAETSTPVLVKIAPDLSDSDLDDIADLAVELDLAGIVATNTTVSRDGLTTPGVDRLGPGGISGPPLAQRAVQVLRRLYDRVGDRLALISVGGIETADDAWERITAGASLLQGYTGFIYGGERWAKDIHEGIARRLHDGGFGSLHEAVGSARRRQPS
ncbi:LOW QUALITY PROTEIN: dihydroorotate dehydrogenase pyrD, partial [Mycobacterium tuberculosis variant africanum K85]